MSRSTASTLSRADSRRASLGGRRRGRRGVGRALVRRGNDSLMLRNGLVGRSWGAGFTPVGGADAQLFLSCRRVRE